MANKTAAIIGSAGQDGTLLKQRLRNLGYVIFYVDRGGLDIENSQVVRDFIFDKRPDEVYYLAAYHHSSEDILPKPSELFGSSFDINTFGPLNFLDAIASVSKSSRFFYASSCHIFEPQLEGVQNEKTVPRPLSPYAISKQVANDICVYFRETYGVFASVGILYNHESPLRKETFVTRKIVKAAVDIAKNNAGNLLLAEPLARVDWGYAPDYVEAMRMILNAKDPDDFIIATGEAHSVYEFATIAFQSVGLKADEFIKIDNNQNKQIRPARIGDATKLTKATGWKPTVSFEEMIERLVQAEIESAN
ncbi:MAG: NAD-dependent epimerase/dehydratase family protein [Alphaproteobacteria bacterium]|nr:NAD-dependent epimerase/dehydratase family protein [Alphaproteobacteria bacterium]